MSAWQKVAWTELIASIAVLLAAFVLYPWLGEGAVAASALLGLIGLCPIPIFLLTSKDKAFNDERDREIELRSQLCGFGASWLCLSLSLLGVGMWYNWLGQAVPSEFAIALVYITFALFYGVKGGSSLFYYRSGRSAA